MDWLNLKYGPLATRIETYGPQKAILGSIWTYLEEKGRNWVVEPGDGSQASKPVRIISLLQPLYERRRIKHHISLKGGQLERQLLRFGVMSADDLPDALYNMVMSAQDGGYAGASPMHHEPKTVKEKLEMGVELSVDERAHSAPTVKTMANYGRKLKERSW